MQEEDETPPAADLVIYGTRESGVQVKALRPLRDSVMRFFASGFFRLPPVSKTQVVHLELRISSRIFDKI
jgi:hypothetical protein